MNREALLETLFPHGWDARTQEADYFHGRARLGPTEFTLIGTAERAEIGVDLALRIAAAVLDTVRYRAREPIVFLLDTRGQRLRRRDELLGLNGYMAHLAKCVEVARQRGHVVLSVVYGEAVSGGYLTTGMMADACYALADAEIKVMNLPAMARITKIPLERLNSLALQSPVFSPGVDNYLRMGHLQEVWEDRYAERLAAALEERIVLAREHGPGDDVRMEAGARRGGRSEAARVSRIVVEHE